MSTSSTYLLRFRVDATGVEHEMRFTSALERALFIVGWSCHITVLGGIK